MISPSAVYAIWSVWEFTPNPPNEFQFMGHLLMNHHNRFCKSVNLQIQKLSDETLIGGVREKTRLWKAFDDIEISSTSSYTSKRKNLRLMNERFEPNEERGPFNANR